jgi:uncharacterized protein (DUF302 family)
MSYYFNKTIEADFESAADRIKEELMKEGFGALTEIDLHEKFKTKLNKDFRKYRIIGACNPKVSYEVLQYDNKVGTMLPCSVVVQEMGNGMTDVSVADPVESLKAIPDENVQKIVAGVRDSVKSAIERL